MSIKKQFGTFELNGETHTVRIGLKAKLQHEKTAKARQWGDIESSPFNTMAFWTWHAAKDKGLHDLSFDDFIDQVEDVAVEYDADSDAEVEGNEQTSGTAEV